MASLRRPFATRGPVRLIGAVALLGIAATACASRGEPRLQELGGWRRETVLGSDEGRGDGGGAVEQVATTTTPGNLAWFTGTPGGDDEQTGFAYRQLDADVPQEATATRRDGNVLIPVGVAADADAWLAVAVTRDRPNGDNTGLLAWQGTTASTTDAPMARRLPPTDEVPAVVSTARGNGVDLVVGPIDGDVVAWRNENTGLWRRSVLDLGVDEAIVFVDVVGLGDRFVLAGVDENGDGHLWSSTDGEDWQPVEAGDEIPSGLASVTLPAPLAEDDLAVVWMAVDEPTRTDVRSGTSATIQRFDGETLSDAGVIDAQTADEVPRFAVTGATMSPEGHLVVVGRAAVQDTTVPMLWLREDGAWQPTPQRELAGRLGYQFRAVTTDDEGMVGVITRWPTGGDVEVWRWRN